MQPIARYSKAIAFFCHFLAILATFGTLFSQAFAAGCEDRLHVQMLNRTRYFDLEYLTSRNETQLRQMLPLLSKLGEEVGRQRQAKSDQLQSLHLAGKLDEALIDSHNRSEEDQRGIKRYSQAIERELERRSKGQTDLSVKIPVFDLHVTGKTDTQMMNDISAVIAKLPGEKESTVLRYFPCAAEDLVRLRGTDLFGRELFSGEAWDEFSLEGLLNQRGLKAEDGFYGVDYGTATHMGTRPNGDPIPFSMVNYFIDGSRALAVYDLDQLEDFFTDYFIFRNPAQKKRALLAIIRPRP